MSKRWKMVLAVAGLLGLSAWNASAAVLIDNTGNIDGWGTPFTSSQLGDWLNGAPPLTTGAGGIQHFQDSTTVFTEANNASPINYNGEPFPFVPSSGEQFDLEFLGWKQLAGNQISVLAITSLNPNTGTVLNNHILHLGDVFIDTNGDGTPDLALTAGQWDATNPDHLTNNTYTHQLDIGLYTVDSVHGITDLAHNGFGDNAFVSGLTDPFTLGSGTALATDGSGLTFREQSFDYGNVGGANEDGTWVLEWTFDASLLGNSLSQLTMHQTTECGNDLISTDPRNDEPFVPEPATLAMVGLGLASMSAIRRRRKIRN